MTILKSQNQRLSEELSRDKGIKAKDSSTLNEDESCLVAQSIELSNLNKIISDFHKVIEFCQSIDF